MSIGTSKAHISITLVNKEGFVGVELYINGEKDLFDSLYAQREAIENELSFCFNWQRLDNKKASRILMKIQGLNFDDHSNYNVLMNDIIDKVIAMRATFKKYL